MKVEFDENDAFFIQLAFMMFDIKYERSRIPEVLMETVKCLAERTYLQGEKPESYLSDERKPNEGVMAPGDR